MGRFYSNQRSGLPISISAVADDLLYKIESALRFPKRSKSTVKITSPILSSDKGRFDNKLLCSILTTSSFYSESWHTLVISPHGDKNVVVDWRNLRLRVRKRRCFVRYDAESGAAVKPFRGYEVTVAMRRERKTSAE